MQHPVILLLATLCSVNLVQSLNCYSCTYEGVGSDSSNCLTPSSSTQTTTCGSSSSVCSKVSATASYGSTTVTVVNRGCSSSGPIGCQTQNQGSASGTVCYCNTNLCNNGRTVHVRSSLYQLLILMILTGAAVFASSGSKL